MPKINSFSMPKERFFASMQEAGFTQDDLLQLVACKESSYNNWIKNEEFPVYIKLILELATKLKRIRKNYPKEFEFIEKNRRLKKELAKKENKELELENPIENALSLQGFTDLVSQCGFESYYSLSYFLHCNIQTIFYWNKTGNYPKYLKQLLEWLVLIREYNDNNKIKFQEYILEYSKEHNEQFKQIQQKNLELKQRLEDCKLMKKVLESKLKSQL